MIEEDLAKVAAGTPDHEDPNWSAGLFLYGLCHERHGHARVAPATSETSGGPDNCVQLRTIVDDQTRVLLTGYFEMNKIRDALKDAR